MIRNKFIKTNRDNNIYIIKCRLFKKVTIYLKILNKLVKKSKK